VDLVPFKTCSYDCIYCQLGRTTRKTVDRKAWVPIDAVLKELRAKLACRPDYITLSGSGEPTLHTGIGMLIDGIKDMTDIPVAVLTNGSLFGNAAVRAQIAAADVLMPSLDAGDAQRFKYINRPHEAVSFRSLVEGLSRMRQEYHGRYWLEIFLLAGVTAIPTEVMKLADIVRQIVPDRVQLNSVARPPSESFACPATRGELQRFAGFFPFPVDVLVDGIESAGSSVRSIHQEELIGLIRRRPCTVDDISAGLGLHRNAVLKEVNALTGSGILDREVYNGMIYYKSKKKKRA
jgi:wyosine [tRNA(Phe)-imidazoG37] synthetase (radical SAM superfamily)